MFVKRILFTFLVFTFFCACKTQKDATQLPYNNSRFIDVDGVQIHYRTWIEVDSVDKPWVLLVHGFSGSTYSWHKTISPLQNAGFNVVALDVPPFGYSDKSTKINHSVDNRAVIIWNFINKINPHTKWHLFGHSMGGGIVAAMAIVQPEKVEKVIFVAPALFGRLQPGRSFRQKLLALYPIEVTLSGLGRLFLVRPSRIANFIESAYGVKGTPADIEAYYKPLKIRGMARAILSSFSRSNPTKTLNIADFKSNAIAIWGDMDSWVPFEGNSHYTQTMDSLSIVIIKDTGHNPMETDADLFNKIVLQFLNEDID